MCGYPLLKNNTGIHCCNPGIILCLNRAESVVFDRFRITALSRSGIRALGYQRNAVIYCKAFNVFILHPYERGVWIVFVSDVERAAVIGCGFDRRLFLP